MTKRKKKFNSKFYNTDFYKLTSVNKVDQNIMIRGKLLGEVTQEFIDTLEKTFDDTTDMLDGAVVFPIRIRKDIAKYCRENGVLCDYDRYVYQHHKIPEGYLYSGWGTGIRTKILPEDLPETYVKVYNYKKRGYIETAGVTDILYRRSPFHNHAFKDDFLYISYSGDIVYEGAFSDINKYDEYIFGGDIVQVVDAIGKNSPEVADKIEEIKSQMVEQYNAFVEHESMWKFNNYKKIEDFNELL